MQFVDRFLKCSDCGNDFVFTAGEQLFFYDKQFENDPKRCKLCKAKRAGLGRSTNPDALTALPFSKTETQTECSDCGIQTTVPFKPTQGRPVLCRECFQKKRVPSAVTVESATESVSSKVAAIEAALNMGPLGVSPEAKVAPAAHEPSMAAMELIAEVPVARLHERRT
jgi:CxxC-x17-CxxC domain-containing protein